MALIRIPFLVASLAAVISAAEAPTTPPAEGTGLTPEQQAFWEAARSDGAANPDLVAAEALYVEARAQYQAARFLEARETVEKALAVYPAHAPAQSLREDILAILGVRDNRLQAANIWLASIQDVKTQETAVRMAAKLAEGDRKMAAGDYSGAELAYDSVDIALRTFPYSFDFGTLPEQVAAKKLEARAKDRQAQISREREDRQNAAQMAESRRAAEEAALAAKVDEMLRRARVAYSRRDFKRAEVDAWNAYELDRRREDARDLYLKARRRGHEQFEVTYREERLERLTRVHEEIHKSLIPQSEVLVYPEDWQRRARRTPPNLGSGKEEPWMDAINARMDQVITFEFEDTAFEDVMAFYRQVTGLNIIVSPDVFTAQPPPITFRARDMRFREALKWVLEMTRMHMAIQNQAIFISDQPIAGALVLRMYDIADLASPVRDMPGRELAYNSDGGGGGGGGFNLFAGNDVEEGQATDPAELADFIQANVAPGLWDADGTAIEVRGTTLFVNQTPEVHQLIVALIDEQRNQSKLQVNVGVRVVDVRKGFFEEIGFNYNNLPTDLIGATTGGALNAPSPYGVANQGNTSFYNGTLNQSALPVPQNNWGYQGSRTPTTALGMQVESTFNIGSFLGQTQVNAIFNAAESEADAQILQHPVITCFNNQRAHAAFMNQYAYIADYEVVNNNLDPVIEVLTYGDIIDVRPVVSSDRKYITMEIRPSSVTLAGVFVELLSAPRVIGTGDGGGVVIPGLTFPIELPNVRIDEVSTTVIVPDGGSLMVGGFNFALDESSSAKVPVLGSIPFLGRLFGRRGLYHVRERLFLLAHVRIIDYQEAEDRL